MRKVSSLLSIVMALAVLISISACSKNEPGSNDESERHQEEQISETQEERILTLATFNLDSMIRDRVMQFNNSNAMYHIEVIDYSEYGAETVIDPNDYGSSFNYYAGLNILTTEIITGKIPDILDLSMMPYYQYASKGLLEDIYPFIDSDPSISRSDLVGGAIQAAEIDGKLFQLFPTFSIKTIVGHPSVLGFDMGWNIDELKEVINANPGADVPLGIGDAVTKTAFLRHIISHNIEEYIDWSSSTVNFDTEYFIEILEFVAATFPNEPVMGDDTNSPSQLLAANRQIMSIVNIADTQNYRYYKAIVGGDIVFKGFPGNMGNHHSVVGFHGLGMTTAAKDKDGVWQFLRTLLDEDFQLSFYNGFPTNRNAFDTFFDKGIEDSKEPDTIYDPMTGEVWFELQALTLEDKNKVLMLIDSMTVTTGFSNLDDAFWNIIFESADDYFSGKSTAQDTARVVQSRVAIYVAERS